MDAGVSRHERDRRGSRRRRHSSRITAERARELHVSRVIPLKGRKPMETERREKQAGWHNFISVPRRAARRMADVRQLQGVQSSRAGIALKFT